MNINSKLAIGDNELFFMITKNLTWYYENCKSPDTNKLLAVRDNLSVLSYNLASIAADLKLDYNTNYYIRKIETARSKQGFIARGKSAAQSETDSIVAMSDHFKNELEAEANSYKVDLLLKQVNKILDAMNQRIAFARSEEYTARKQENNV